MYRLDELIQDLYIDTGALETYIMVFGALIISILWFFIWTKCLYKIGEE